MPIATTNCDSSSRRVRMNHERLFAVDSPIWKTWACGHPRRPKQERQPWQICPACEAAATRSRKYIAGHVALLLLQLVLGFFMLGGGR
jgi:hypothetical protein